MELTLLFRDKEELGLAVLTWKIVQLCCAQSLSLVQLFATPQTAACQASLFMVILQEKILEWVGMPFSRGIFLTQEWNHYLLHFRQILQQLNHQASLQLSDQASLVQLRDFFFFFWEGHSRGESLLLSYVKSSCSHQMPQQDLIVCFNFRPYYMRDIYSASLNRKH